MRTLLQPAAPLLRRPDARPPRPAEAGGAALEYILVSTFAAVVGVAALGFVGKVVETELTNLAAKLGLDLDPDLGDPFGRGE